MPAVVRLRRTGRGFSRPSRPRLVEAGTRRAGALALRGMLAAMPTAAAAALLAFVLLAFVRLAGFAALGCLRRLAHPRNALADQLLDRRDALALGGRNDGDCGTAASGAAGAADAMDVIVGMVRDVEIEDVTDRGNVEATRRHVGGDQQGDFVFAELIERRHARRLVHVAVQRARGKAVA